MSRLDEIIQNRKEKLESLEKEGLVAYPYGPSWPRQEIEDVLSKLRDPENIPDIEVNLMGRLMGLRFHGKVAFADLKDYSGSIQLLFRTDGLKNPTAFELLSNLDIGDIVECQGKPLITKQGQKSIDVSHWNILAKSMRPLPDTWSGLSDHELKYRMRELDLIMNPDSRKIFESRAVCFESIREFMTEHGFLEVHTPILQNIPGGTLAEPFKTKHNSLDISLFLRIAPELYLKRLIVGGFEKVYELGPNFRNEGISPQHLQEFYTAEAYQAYAVADDWIKPTKDLIAKIAKAIHGSAEIEISETKYNLDNDWQEFEYADLIKSNTNIDIEAATTEELLDAQIKSNKLKVEVPKYAGWAKKVDEIFKTYVRPKLIGPTIVKTYPKALSPLAKTLDSKQDFVGQFQVVMNGYEVVKAYTELNDPFEQQLRFAEQEIEISKGDKEAHPSDPDFIKSLEYGMPPTAGWGMGVDRLLTIILNKENIREVVLFPLMRPEQ